MSKITNDLAKKGVAKLDIKFKTQFEQTGAAQLVSQLEEIQKQYGNILNPKDAAAIEQTITKITNLLIKSQNAMSPKQITTIAAKIREMYSGLRALQTRVDGDTIKDTDKINKLEQEKVKLLEKQEELIKKRKNLSAKDIKTSSKERQDFLRANPQVIQEAWVEAWTTGRDGATKEEHAQRDILKLIGFDPNNTKQNIEQRLKNYVGKHKTEKSAAYEKASYERFTDKLNELITNGAAAKPLAQADANLQSKITSLQTELDNLTAAITGEEQKVAAMQEQVDAAKAKVIATAEANKSGKVDTPLTEAEERYKEETKGQADDLMAKADKDVSGLFDELKNRFFSITALFFGLKKAAESVIQVTTELDKAFNDIAVVSQYSTKEVWGMYNDFLGIAQRAGGTSTEIIGIAGEYFRQGKAYSEVLVLTETAAKAAKVAGISAGDSVNYLTSALNGYNLAASEALNVSDKFAALAAGSATDYEELAIALSKVAAQASASGVEMDSLLGFIAKALETTREAPENIGTAFKTIFARMGEIKDYGKTMEDNLSANKISKSLHSIGVALFDDNNEMRAMDDVLIEVGRKWKDLDSVQQRYIATTLAGTRQQTRLISIFQDFDRTMELVNMSSNSAGATLAQHQKYTEGLEYSLTRVNTAWQSLIKSYSNSTVIKGAVDMLASLVEGFSALPSWITLTAGGVTSLFYAIGSFEGNITAWLPTLFKKTQDKWETFAATVLVGFNTIGEKARELKDDLFKLIGGLSKAQIGLGAVATIATIALSAWIMSIQHARKEIKNLFTEQYDRENSFKSVESLIQQYEKLSTTIGKTKEQLEELHNLQQQIIDTAGVDLTKNGKVNHQAIQKWKEEQRKATQENMNSLQQNIKIGYGSNAGAYLRGDDITKQQAITAETYSYLSNAGLDYWDAINNQTQEGIELLNEYRNAAQLILKLDLQSTSEKIETDKLHGRYNAIVRRDPKNQQLYKDTILGNAIKEEDSTKFMLQQLGFANENGEIDHTKMAQTIIETADLSLQEVQDYFNAKGVNLIDSFNNATPAGQQLFSLIFGENDTLSASSELASLLQIAIEDAYELVDTQGLTNDTIFNTQNVFQDIDFKNEEDKIKFYRTIFSELKNGQPTLQGIATGLKEIGIESAEAMPYLIDFFDTFSDIDALDNSLTSLRSVEKEVNDFNSALSGGTWSYQELFNLLMGYPELSDEIINSISEQGYISEKVAQQMYNADKQQFLKRLDFEIKHAKAKENLLTDQLNNVKAMLKAQTQQELLAAKSRYDIAIQEFNEENEAYAEKLNDRVRMDKEAEQGLTDIKSMNIANTFNADAWHKQHDEALKAYQAVLEEELKNATTNREALEATYNSILNGTLKLSGGFQEVGKAAGDAKDEFADYERELNEVYKATQKLAGVTSRLDFIESLKDLYNERDGGEYKYLLQEQTKELKNQIIAYENLIKAQKGERDALLKDVNPAVRDAFTIVDGRLIPVLDKYNKLSNEDAKSADELADAFNGLTDEILDNANSIVSNESALKELEEERRDMVIETQEILIEAIRAEQKAIYEEKKAGLEKEKELLEERKKMYEEAFKEEDYQDELGTIEEKRQNLIQQLSGLEGATDSESKRKHAELLEELKNLNQDYNDKTTEYNRDALIDRIDDEIEKNDELQEELQKDYEERIEDYAWLQEQLEALTAQGVEACLEYLKTWHDDYKNGTIEMKEKVEQQWRFLFETVYGQVDKIKLQSKDAINSIKDVINEIDGMISKWNEAAAAKSKVTGSPTSSPESNPTPEDNYQKTWHFKDGGYTYNSGTNIISEAISRADKYVPYYHRNRGEWKYYKNGGYVDYTGPAWVDGSKTSPEAFLSARDTANFEQLKLSLDRAYSTTGATPFNSSIVVEEVNVHTDHLNNDQDFYQGGMQFASGLQDALHARGIVSNLKR